MAELPELGRGFTHKFPKLFIEMAQVIESAIVTDVHNIQFRIEQELTSIFDFNLI